MSTSLLSVAQVQLTRYGSSLLLLLGTIGNVLILCIFSKNSRNACKIYLMGSAVMNTVSLFFNVPIYHITAIYGDPTSNSIVVCKLRSYLAHVFGQMARYFFVMACIDRFVVTSTHASIRGLSRPSIAWCVMIIHTIIWILFGLHLLLLTTIINGRCGQYGLYLALSSLYNLLFFCLIPVLMMITFGYMSYKNMRKIHARVRPTENDSTNIVSIRRIDRDMLIMVIAEIICYSITMIVYPIIALEITISNYIVIDKSIERLQIEGFIMFFAQFLISTNNSLPFYLYLSVSKNFRNEVKKFLNKYWRKLTGQPAAIEVPITI